VTRIPDLLQQGRCYSFEFFPPRSPEAEATLEATLIDLEPLQPSYVSVTYGAGGSTRERTHDLVVRINERHALCAMAHLTCVGHSRAELVDIVSRYRDAGVDNILALGGDPPAGVELPPGELEHAVELVRLIREVGEFAIGVAAHPEPHPRSPDRVSDRRHTAEKLAEADFAVTQFFFEPHHYFDLVDSMRALGADKPVIPGIMPVTSISGIARMAKLQGSEFPEWLARRLHEVEDDPEAVRRVGVEEATTLCRALLDGGAPGLHFYTLNRSTATREIYANLGLGG
jgi:methylenetetrahydrofolate reductase (NADPH)